MNHRGRIQAQGEKLEESESWAQNEPLTKTEGLNMLQRLMNKLSKNDKDKRQKAYKNAVKYIETAAENGGISATVSKSFYAKDTPKERIDIEVRQGIAFVPDEDPKKDNE